ncbi:MAG: YfcE family phosphodiesterase [Elusimicrobia bacterium RIFOXYD2_FULL_34_15]|nr:MAG: YfcE family phosphodiesterase [Elusimicrobia bacterium RIFOXYD2_FULL_34_15]
MLIGIMSDSHDNLDNIEKAVNIFNQRKVDIVLHAGDLVSPFTANEFEKLKAKFIGVFGNNDGDKPFLIRRFKDIGELHDDPFTFEIDGKKVVLMHAPKFLDELLEDKRYDIVIYGHTHKVDVRKGTSLVINPGECGGWLYGKSTVAILDTKTLNPEIIDL